MTESGPQAAGGHTSTSVCENVTARFFITGLKKKTSNRNGVPGGPVKAKSGRVRAVLAGIACPHAQRGVLQGGVASFELGTRGERQDEHSRNYVSSVFDGAERRHLLHRVWPPVQTRWQFIRTRLHLQAPVSVVCPQNETTLVACGRREQQCSPQLFGAQTDAGVIDGERRSAGTQKAHPLCPSHAPSERAGL